MKLQIDKIKVGKRFRKQVGDLESLKASIQELGLLHPIVISEHNELICGFRRLRACEELGRPVDVRVVNIEHWIEAEYDENTERKDFTLDEKVSIMEAIQERIGKRQGKRTDLKHSVPNGSQLPASGKEVEKQPDPGQETLDFAAKEAGLSSASRASEVKIVLAKGCAQLIKMMEENVIGARRASWLCRLSKEEQVPIVEQGRKEVIHRAKLLQIEDQRKRTYKKAGARNASALKAQKRKLAKSDIDLVEKELQAKFRGFWARTAAIYAPRIGSQRLLQIFIQYLQTLLAH